MIFSTHKCALSIAIADEAIGYLRIIRGYDPVKELGIKAPTLRET